MRRFGLPEMLGIVVSLVCLAWWSPINDYLAGPKQVVLVAGGLALVPAAIYRWRNGQRPNRLGLILVGFAVALPVWAAISWLGSGAPAANSFFGWWGRANGILSLVGGAALLFAASSLRRDEFGRVLTWILAGGTAMGLLGLAQLSGQQIVGGQPDTSLIVSMGNINFSAAYFAIILVLAVGRTLDSAYTATMRVWGAALTALMVVLIIANGSEQGPASAFGGLLALAVLWALSYRGPRRAAALATVGSVVVVSATLSLASFAGVGPVAGLWESVNFRVRQGTWLTAWNILQSMPAFGTGPDGFQRYANQYSPDFYVELVGVRTQLSAAHNVPLQYGATLGWLGLMLWVVLMVGIGIALLASTARSTSTLSFTLASVGGALTAYFVQAQVSIDVGGLLALGWLLAGMGIADSCARNQGTPPQVSPPSKGRSTESRGRTSRVLKELESKAPVWVPLAGAGLGLVGFSIALVPVVHDAQTTGDQTQNSLIALVESPLTPCSVRLPLLQVVVQRTPAQLSVPAVSAAADLDPRCDTIAQLQADFALQQQDTVVADRASLDSTVFNPKDTQSWIVRSRYHLLMGDLTAAENDYATAAALIQQFPGNEPAQEVLARLRIDLDASRTNW